jgi:hypothetical protein
LRDGEGQLALRQIGEVADLHAEVAFQRRDELLVPLGHELVVKRLHRRVVPEQPLRRLLAGGAQRGEVRHGDEQQRVRRQQVFRRRNRGADGRGERQQRGERREKNAAAALGNQTGNFVVIMELKFSGGEKSRKLGVQIHFAAGWFLVRLGGSR